MLIIENLSKVYHGRHGDVRALDDISLRINTGDFVTVTGGSGSGKTTLLLSIGGLIRPTAGTITYGDFDLCSSPEKDLAYYRNKKVGFVLQTFNLIPYLDAIQNVMVPMVIQASKNGPMQDRADALMRKVGLYERRFHLPRELSVGQQQRVAIARALANEPEMILADEPTGNLDPSLATEVLGIFQELNESEGKTIIMVTHSPDAAKFGSVQMHLKDGRLEAFQSQSKDACDG
ncbi:MAG: ABC transporter ATP-binding protein [Syntrophobacteraceae bacterium]